MDKINVIKKNVTAIYPDEIHGLLYCVTSGSSVLVLNSETGELIASLLVGQDMEQFFFDENKELFIVKSGGCRFRAYKVNEYAKPLWKMKLKGDNTASDFVYRDGKLYGVAQTYLGGVSAIRYFVFDVHTLEVKSEVHKEARSIRAEDLKGVKGELHDIVEAERERAKRESKGNGHTKYSEKYADVPFAYLLYKNEKFDFVTMGNEKFDFFMGEKFYVIPKGADMPKDFASAIEKEKIKNATLKLIDEHTVSEFRIIVANDKKGELYCFSENSVSVFDLNSAKFTGETAFELPKYEKLTLCCDGDFLVVENEGKYTFYAVNDFTEPYWEVDCNGLDGDYLSWNFILDDKLYCEKTDAHKNEKEVEKELEKMKGENDGYDPSKYRDLKKAFNTGNYEVVDIPYSAFYYIGDIRTKKIKKTELEFVYKASVLYYHVWGGNLNKKPPEEFAAALEEYKESRSRRSPVKTKMPKCYEYAGVSYYYEAEGFEIVSTSGKLAVIPKVGKKREENQTAGGEEGEERVLTLKYIEENDPYDVIETGYSIALEKLEAEAKQKGVALEEYVYGEIDEVDKVLYGIGWMQVYSGDEGTTEYFTNGGTSDGRLLVEALKTVSALDTAKAAEKCIKAVEAYNKKQSASEEAYERLSEKLEEIWEGVDEEYAALTIEYLKRKLS